MESERAAQSKVVRMMIPGVGQNAGATDPQKGPRWRGHFKETDCKRVVYSPSQIVEVAVLKM
jgi:hypothetical protein